MLSYCPLSKSTPNKLKTCEIRNKVIYLYCHNFRQRKFNFVKNMSKHKINKQEAVTFQIVHRSQQDPLIVDENAPQRVLVPVRYKETKVNNQQLRKTEFDLDNGNQKDPVYGTNTKSDKKEKKIKFKLPSVVFPSEIEEEVGMLGKAAPVSGLQLHLDPDVTAAMDEDFDYSDPENQLEDNFLELANGVDIANQEYDDDDMFSTSNESDAFSQESNDEFQNEETKSRFTNYSMTSSVIRRNDKLSLLDDKFEQMYIGYDENEIGALDMEEIEGPSNMLESALDEFNKCKDNLQLDKANLSNKIKETLEEIDEEEEGELVKILDSKHKWDCESILTSYSNIYNHPKLIVEPKTEKIQINKKTGIPSNVFDSNTLTSKTLHRLNQQNANNFDNDVAPSQLSILSTRSKNESVEERKIRKQKLKEYRKERRIEKKMNSLAFKDETKRQIKITENNKNNLQGNKLL